MAHAIPCYVDSVPLGSCAACSRACKRLSLVHGWSRGKRLTSHWVLELPCLLCSRWRQLCGFLTLCYFRKMGCALLASSDFQFSTNCFCVASCPYLQILSNPAACSAPRCIRFPFVETRPYPGDICRVLRKTISVSSEMGLRPYLSQNPRAGLELSLQHTKPKSVRDYCTKNPLV